MVFNSRLTLPPRPNCDTFNYIFNQGRRAYPKNRVLFRVDDSNDTLTLAELETKSRQFAQALQSRYGIKPNDTVSILAKDRIQYPIAYYGALAAGATVALIPIQIEMSETDVAARVKQSKSKVLITDSTMLTFAEFVSALIGCIPLITMDANPTNDQKWPTLEELVEGKDPAKIIFHLDSE
jgi:4-coumarate--CoA ligase